MTKCLSLGGLRNRNVTITAGQPGKSEINFLAHLVLKKTFFLVFRLMASCYVLMWGWDIEWELENFNLSSLTVVQILPQWAPTCDLINFWCGFNMVCVPQVHLLTAWFTAKLDDVSGARTFKRWILTLRSNILRHVFERCPCSTPFLSPFPSLP